MSFNSDFSSCSACVLSVLHIFRHLVFLGSDRYPYKGILDNLANRSFADGTNAWTGESNPFLSSESCISDIYLASQTLTTLPIRSSVPEERASSRSSLVSINFEVLLLARRPDVLLAAQSTSTTFCTLLSLPRALSPR